MLKLHAQHSQERRQVVLLNPARFLVENELASLLKKLGSRERDAPATAAQARAARVLSASTSGRAQVRGRVERNARVSLSMCCAACPCFPFLQRCDAPRTSSASGRARQASQEDPMELRGETPQSSRVASPPPGVGHTEAWGGGGGGSGGGPGHRRPPTSRPHVSFCARLEGFDVERGLWCPLWGTLLAVALLAFSSPWCFLDAAFEPTGVIAASLATLPRPAVDATEHVVDERVGAG